VLDCLRADHVTAYGYSRPTTPALDSLAADGVLFRRAFSPSYWTRPSVGTYLTGLYPSEHGLLGLESAGRRDEAALSPAARTLAEDLQGAGYRTAMIAFQAQLSVRFGLNRGFETYVTRGGPAHSLNQRFLRWLDTASPGRFFAYLHYLDLHWPYCAGPRFRGRFQRGGGSIDPCRSPRELLERFHAGEIELGPRDVENLIDHYDEELVGLDASIYSLFATLRERGLWEETLIVATSDHGEEFMEKGTLTHRGGLWDHLIHVPLIVKPPVSWGPPRGTRVDSLVEVRDLVATLRRLTGTESPRVEDPDFIPWLVGRRHPSPREAIVAESLDEVVVRTEEWKLHQPKHEGELRLFHLSVDPTESNDIAAANPEIVQQLQARLRHWQASLTPFAPEDVQLDPATLRGLEALGYLNRGSGD
jgi:arylsulfatase A-like enzyme